MASKYYALTHAVADAIAEATSVDSAYNARLKAVANGTYVSTETHLSTSPGLDDRPDSSWSTTEVAMWWAALDVADQKALMADPFNWELLGNTDGLPAAVRDAANRKRLPGMIDDAQREYDAAKTKWDEISKDFELSSEQMKSYYDAWLKAEERLTELRTVESTLTLSKSSDPLSLLVLDGTSGERLKAAVAVGDVDSAKHVATFVPGMTTNVTDSLAAYTTDMVRLRKATADNIYGVSRSDVGTIAWLGYDAPQSVLSAAMTQKAHAGANSLTPFLEGMNASRTTSGTDPHLTLLGHSYGSTTSGFAMSQMDADVVDDFIMFGSPGSGVQSVSEYAIDQGSVFVSGVPEGDWVQGVGPDAAFGINPMRLEGVEHLSNDATGSANYQDFGFDPFRNHSTYLDDDTQTLYDISKVVGGRR
ncbi:alpha/beta hydrolase [Schaalia vaccimaxillae]|uniref:alpha/beta hydrolase n=1 Tax=Schaalia vaccimaxillae TaxID=183916 RepID=UPI000411F81F|nr:alpha/beta hydrolase [Schaalia vaccimaxillae]